MVKDLKIKIIIFILISFLSSVSFAEDCTPYFNFSPTSFPTDYTLFWKGSSFSYDSTFQGSSSFPFRIDDFNYYGLVYRVPVVVALNFTTYMQTPTNGKFIFRLFPYAGDTGTYPMSDIDAFLSASFPQCDGYQKMATQSFKMVTDSVLFYSSDCAVGYKNQNGSCSKMFNVFAGVLTGYKPDPIPCVPFSCSSGSYFSPSDCSCLPCVNTLGSCEVYGSECNPETKPVEYRFNYFTTCEGVEAGKVLLTFEHKFFYDGQEVEEECFSNPHSVIKVEKYDIETDETTFVELQDITHVESLVVDIGLRYSFNYSYFLPPSIISENDISPFYFSCSSGCNPFFDSSSFDDVINNLNSAFPFSVLFWISDFFDFSPDDFVPFVLSVPFFGAIELTFPDLSWFRMFLLLYLVFCLVRFLLRVLGIGGIIGGGGGGGPVCT
ncbi:MAG: hypothetical protein LLF28_02820 [Nitrospiraceae bacterium]|nr:hypothetical protein [Nitrospiraceae bacterium]